MIKEKPAEKPAKQKNIIPQYRELADNLRDLVIATDISGRIIYANKSACETSDYTKKEALQMNVLDIIPSEYHPAVEQRMASRRAGNKDIDPYEIEIVGKSGRRIFLEVSSTLITYEDMPQGILLFARNIVERKKMETALKSGEKKFREFADLLPGSAFECDLNFKTTFINKKALKTYGYTKEDIDAGLNILKTIAPEEIDNLLLSVAGMMEGTVKHPVEATAVRKDGTHFPVHISAAAIMDDGKPVGIRGVAVDITQYKEKALRQSEARYRAMIDTLEDGYYEVDLKGKLTNFNNASLRMVEFTKEELTGASFKTYCSPEYQEKIFLEFNKVYTTGIPAHGIELAVVKKDGKKHIGELSIALMRDEKGKPTGFRGIVRDITARIKMEDELRESRERFKNMVANVPGIIFQWVIHHDGSSNLTYVSESIAELGLDVQKLANNPLMVFTFFRKEDKKRLLSDIAEAVQSSGHLNWEGPTTINDITRWHRCLASPRRQDNGDIIFDGLILDMTENKKAEQEKKELEEYLQQAQKLESIGTLAGGIAHDFNNLLMGIQGYASLMLMDTDPAHPHYRKLKSIEEMVISGANLTRQLLGYARRGRYEVKPANINEIVEKTITMFGRTRKEISLHQQYQKDVWSVEVDQGQIEQVLLNLYVNAWQAMPGGGDLYLDTQNIILHEDAAKLYGINCCRYVKIGITDTGVGMDEATRSRIFEPFFTTKEMGRGTGLGLASVYGIIKGHNGIIDVISEKGRGTAFNIYLPASDKKFIEETKQVAAPVEKNCSETLLVVDDEDNVINVTREILQALGYKILAARSGYEAVRIYQDRCQEISLVILDMVMPGMNGGETYDALKNINPDIKVILSSGYSLDGKATAIMNKGCQCFIQKPFKIEDISQRIREILAGNNN